MLEYNTDLILGYLCRNGYGIIGECTSSSTASGCSRRTSSQGAAAACKARDVDDERSGATGLLTVPEDDHAPTKEELTEANPLP